jgi:MFS family permease
MPAPEDRRARAATTAVFFVTGFVVAAWATRIPAIQGQLGLSPGGFAVAVLGLEGGALVGLPAGGAGLLAGLAATRWLVTEPRRPRQPLLARPGGRLLLLGAIAFCAFLLDGTANNWSAAHLHGERGAGPALAAAAVPVLLAARALGPDRTAGERQPSLR